MKSVTQQPDKTNTLTKLSTTLLYLVVFIQWGTLFLLTWREFPFPLAWKIDDWSFNRSDVTAATIDEDGDPWLIIDRRFGNKAYQLRYVKQGGVVSWNLPFLTLQDAIFTTILKDENNDPWLILGKQLAHWEGDQWKFMPMPLDAEILDVIPPTVVIKNEIVWGIDMTPDENRIIKLDLNQDPIQATEILLPDGLDTQQYKFNCIISMPDGLLTVLSNDQQVAIHQLQNDEWNKITSFAQNKQASNVHVVDVALDTKGQIWVLLQSRPLIEKFVGRYDPKENIWTWLEVEHPEQNISYIEYEHIAVDRFSRVWLSATQYGNNRDYFSSNKFVANAIGVYEEIPSEKLAVVQSYSSRNSSLQTSSVSHIVIGPDQKIWTWNKQLVWMDSGQQELPKPLPNWFVLLIENKTLLLVVSVILLIVITIIQVRIRKYKSANSIKKV